jgi:hypothetical protein
MFVRRATRHGRRLWLIEERHREVAKSEQPGVGTRRSCVYFSIKKGLALIYILGLGSRKKAQI